MSELQHDRELERYLQGGDPLSRAYDSLRAEMPSSELDRAVLKKARAALSAQRKLPMWPAYGAIAATVVLSFALVLQVSVETEHEAPGSTPIPAEVLSKSGAQPHEEVVVPLDLPPRAAPSPAMTVPWDEAAVTAEKEGVDSALGRQPHADAAKVRDSRREGPNETAATVGGGTAAKARMPVQEPLPAAESVTRETSNASSPYERRREADAYAASQSLGAQRAGTPAALPPESWLQQIEQLRKAGKHEEAEREMKRFREAYPGYLESGEAQPTK